MTKVAVCAVLVALASSGIASRARGQQQAVAVARDGFIMYQPRRANISVVGWDRDSVRLTMERPGTVRLEVERIRGGIQILERRASAADTSQPNVTLYVPRGANLRVTTQAGRLSFHGLTGALKGMVIDGAVRGDSLGGTVELSSVTGSVELRRSEGVLVARSLAAPVSLLGVAGTIRARSTSGDIRIALAGASGVTVDTWSGQVTVEGPMGGASSSVTTHSGNVVLHLPAGANRTLVVSGSRVVAAGACRASPAGSSGDQRGLVNIGGGGDPIDILTFSGSIRVSCGR